MPMAPANSAGRYFEIAPADGRRSCQLEEAEASGTSPFCGQLVKQLGDGPCLYRDRQICQRLPVDADEHISVGGLTRQDLSVTFPARLASVITRNELCNVRSARLCQRDKSPIAMISELARCALRQWKSRPAQSCKALSRNVAKSTSESIQPEAICSSCW